MEEVVLLQNLLSGDREARIEAATEVGRLTSKQRHKLVENDVMVPLISMLLSQDVQAIEAALLSLLSLAFGSERNKIRIVQSGALTVLLKLLRSENKVLIELTVAAMLVLSSCKANKLPIASSGAIRLMIKVLNMNDTTVVSMQARIDAVATLHNLSTCHQIVQSMVSSGAVFSLLQIMECSSEATSQLVDKAIALLDDIVISSKNALEEAAGACGGGAIRALVETIEEGSTKCKEHAVRILLVMCRSCREKYRGLILREGAMPGLLQLSVDGTWRAKTMATELLFLLRDGSNYDSNNKQTRNMVIEQIMQEIDAEEDKVAETSTRALMLVEEMLAKISGARVF